jgi:hypothetical protein
MTFAVKNGRLGFFLPNGQFFKDAFININVSNPLRFYVIAQGGLQNEVTMSYLGALNVISHPADNTVSCLRLSLALAAQHKL